MDLASQVPFWRVAVAIGSLFWFGFDSVMAAVSDHTPTSGETVTVDTFPPNPDTIGIQALPGSTHVTVNVFPGSQISVANNGILVRDQSQITNEGAITVTGNTFDGLDFDNNNTIVSRGTIATSGVESEGMFSTGSNNAVLNDTGGTITTDGENSTGMLIFGGGSGNTLTNHGTIRTSGTGSNGLGADGEGNQLINAGTITTSGAAANGIFANGSNNTLFNSGTINVSGLNAHGITSLGTVLGPITNSGAITATGPGGLGAFLGGPAMFTNTTTGLMMSQQASGVIANAGGAINNAGTIIGATGITSANGAAVIINSGAITGLTSPGLVFQGNFNNTLINTGTITGNGPRVSGVPTTVQFGSGNDTLIMQAGLINGGVMMSNSANAVTLSTSGVIKGFLNLGTSTASTLTLDGPGTQIYSVAVTNGTTFNGALIKNGTGTWALDGSFTYSGGTTVNAGTLQLGNGGAAGSIVGNVVDNGTLAFKRSDVITFPGVISGNGSVTQSGTGTTILTADNTYSGDTTITAGTLQLGNGGTTGTIIGNVVDSGTLVFDRSGDKKTFAGVVSGSGSVVKLGSDTLVLTANNTYTGGTTIAAGTLQLGNGGTGGSVLGNILDNGALVFNRSDAVTYSGIVSGTGSLTQLGPGTLILTANNTYTGSTTIAAGTLQLGNGGTTGSIIGNVEDNGTLVFNRSGAKKTFDGVISGSGSVVKLGSDTLVLTQVNSYSGSTTIEEGVLVIGTPTGTEAISFALGTGNVFLNGGTLRAPSLDPVIINVGGNYIQGPGGTLALGVAGINGVDYDHVQVGGNASLNGTLAVSSLNNFRPGAGNAFEVLRTSASQSGKFAQVNDFLNNSPNLQRIDLYASNGVALVYVAAPTPVPTPTPTPPTPGPTPSPTPNPRPPIDVVVPKPLPPVDSEEPLLISSLLSLLDPTAEQLTAIYEIGFSQANTQRFKLDERFDEIQRGSTGFVSNLPPVPAPVTSTATGKEIATKQPVSPPPPPENRWGVWANGWGDWVTVDNDGQVKGYNFTTGGFIMGVDYRITDHFALGLMGGYAYTRTDLQPSGDIDANTGRGGLYLTYFGNGFYVNAAAYGGHNTYDTSRQAILGAANGSSSGGEFSTWTEAGYDFHFGNFSVGPMAAFQYTLVHIDGFNEQGSLLPLQIHSDTETSLRTDFGARATYTAHVGSVLVIPTLTVAWEHEYDYSSLPITASFVEFPGRTATLFGPSEGRNSAIINAGVATQWTPRFSTFIGYQGQQGRTNYNANAVTGGFSFSF